MEDILAVIVVGLFVAAVVGIAVAAHKFALKRKREEEAYMASRKKQIEEYWANKEKERAQRVKEVNSKPLKSPMDEYVAALGKAPEVKIPPKKTETYTSTTTTRSSDSSDDGFLTGALVGYAVNSLLHSGSSSASEERSVGVSSRESSWGFDDNDSRSSISSSMDTSSSWSSSDFGSSDSGPSSDW